MSKALSFGAAVLLITSALVWSPAPAHADLVGAAAPCDVARTMTWRQAAIDPAPDLTKLIEKDGTEHVVIINEIRRSPFSDEQLPRAFCYAMVKTIQHTAIYKFWYMDVPEGTELHAIVYRPLEGNPPADLTIAAAAPYLPDAEYKANRIARLSGGFVGCRLRDKAWGQALRDKLMTAVRKDRPDLVAEVESIMTDNDYYLAHTGPTKSRASCNTRENNADARDGDDITLGRQSVWGDPFDRRD